MAGNFNPDLSSDDLDYANARPEPPAKKRATRSCTARPPSFIALALDLFRPTCKYDCTPYGRTMGQTELMWSAVIYIRQRYWDTDDWYERLTRPPGLSVALKRIRRLRIVIARDEDDEQHKTSSIRYGDWDELGSYMDL